MTSGNTTGIPKDKVQQTRLLHLAKGRKVTRKVICDAIRIHYATTTGYTEAAAEWVKDLMVAGSIVWLLTTVHPHPDIKPGDTTDIQEIDEANLSDLNAHEGLIVGVPTWHTGADTERSGTDWDSLLDDIKDLDLKDKPVAVFGLGDSAGYGDNFCDAIEEIHDVFSSAGAKMIGYVPTEEYQFEASKAVRDGKFLGLPLDANNEDDLTEERVKAWTAQLVAEGMKA